MNDVMMADCFLHIKEAIDEIGELQRACMVVMVLLMHH